MVLFKNCSLKGFFGKPTMVLRWHCCEKTFWKLGVFLKRKYIDGFQRKMSLSKGSPVTAKGSKTFLKPLFLRIHRLNRKQLCAKIIKIIRSVS